jgi:MFS family permease
MLEGSGRLWKVGLIPQAMANGLASILVLFYVLSGLKGGLIDVGLVVGVSALALIPSQMLWGRMIDGAGRTKPFLVLGFAGMGVSFAAIPWVGSVAGLLVLVSLKSVLYAATLPARQLLTVESERREGWKRGLANMQFLTASGETIGMGVGTALVAFVGFSELFLLCGVLCFVSALALGVLAREPGIMIQRKLVAMERSTSTLVAMSEVVGYSGRGPRGEAYGRVARMLDNSTKYLLVGIFVFSLAGSSFYSPLPAYFLQFYSSSLTFFVFFAGSLAGAVCYLAVGRMGQSAAKSLAISAAMRMVAIPLLVLAAVGATSGLVMAVLVIMVLEVLWSLFDVSSTLAFLETAQVGRAGFYGGIVGMGSAGGGFLGGYVSEQFGFASLFALCGVLCVCALGAFVLQFRGR